MKAPRGTGAPTDCEYLGVLLKQPFESLASNIDWGDEVSGSGQGKLGYGVTTCNVESGDRDEISQLSAATLGHNVAVTGFAHGAILRPAGRTVPRGTADKKQRA